MRNEFAFTEAQPVGHMNSVGGRDIVLCAYLHTCTAVPLPALM
jgi:hypothetical protein